MFVKISGVAISRLPPSGCRPDPRASAEIFHRGQRRNFAYPFQVADDAKQMGVHKTLYPFYPFVCTGWTSILNPLSEMFSTLRLSVMFFLFINCLISIFRALSTISHNLRIINGQNNMNGEKTRKLETRKIVSSNEKYDYMLTTLSDNLLKLEHHTGLKKLSRWITKIRQSNYSFALSAY